MSKNSGRTTKRSLAVINYNGYDIIKVSVTEHDFSHVLQCYLDWGRTRVHYNFCETGNVTKPSTHYGAYANSIDECKKCIDNFIKDDSLYFTDGERQKYVYGPNHKNGWGFTYDSLMKLMREHQKANKRIKILLEDRLEDANFHSQCGLLSECKYKEYEELAAKTCAFREKFEIVTNTQRKRIKEPEKFVDGLKKVLEDYFNAQGIGETSVDVKFIADW